MVDLFGVVTAAVTAVIELLLAVFGVPAEFLEVSSWVVVSSNGVVVFLDTLRTVLALDSDLMLFLLPGLTGKFKTWCCSLSLVKLDPKISSLVSSASFTSLSLPDKTFKASLLYLSNLDKLVIIDLAVSKVV